MIPAFKQEKALVKVIVKYSRRFVSSSSSRAGSCQVGQFGTCRDRRHDAGCVGRIISRSAPGIISVVSCYSILGNNVTGPGWSGGKHSVYCHLILSFWGK